MIASLISSKVEPEPPWNTKFTGFSAVPNFSEHISENYQGFLESILRFLVCKHRVRYQKLQQL
jgi:hypothetical protein